MVEHPGIEITAETMKQNCRFGSVATPEVVDAGSMNIRSLKNRTRHFFVGFFGNVVGLKICNIMIDLRVGSGGVRNHAQQAAYVDDITLRAPLFGGARPRSRPRSR